MQCRSCGEELAEGARFCSSCGQSVADAPDERRVVTVLFADLVGFTGLSERLDPEAVKGVVDGAFQRLVGDVTTFGGRVDKIVGDAIVALFGAPTAHEDDAERAVRAGLRMQDTLAAYAAERGLDIRMRVGVNTGEVLVGALRAGGDYTAMGDVVNLASRLQGSADPGTVVVGGATHAATREVVRYESVGTVLARGREQPVEVWVARGAVLPPGYRPSRERGPLVGREAELALLANAVELSIRHRRLQVILLLGEAGVGKSRLAAEVRDVVREQHPDAAVLNGRCVPYGEANPWWPIADAVRDGLGLALDDPRESAAEAIRDTVGRLVGPEDDDVVAGLLHLLGYESSLRGLDPGRARVEAGRALQVLLEAWVDEHPLVVRIADLHWADDLVFELIDELAGNLARTPFVVLATARPAVLDRWSPAAGRHHATVLHLEPIERAAAARLLDELSTGALPAHLRETLLDRAGGNPLYLEELVTLVGHDDATDPDGGLRELPDTLRGLIAARVDALVAEEQHVLEDAATWGNSGPVEALERLGSAVRGAVGVAAVVQSLDSKEVLSFDGERWSFRSDLVREVAYARLTKSDRLQRHRGIAAYLDQASGGEFIDDAFVETVARHYAVAARLAMELSTAGGNDSGGLVDAAGRWLGEAIRRAERAAAWVLAERLADELERLLTAAGRPPAARVVPMLARARARTQLWRGAEALVDVERVLDHAVAEADEALAAAARLVAGDARTKVGDADGARAELARAIDHFEAVGDLHGRAEARRLVGMAAIFANDYAAAEVPVAEALADFRAVDDPRGIAWAVQNLAWIAFMGGRVGEAEERIGEARQAFRRVGDLGGLAWTEGLLAFLRFSQGRMDEARELAARVLRESERRAERWGQGMMLLVLAGVDLWSGRTAEAERQAARADELLASVGDHIGRMQAAALRARALVMTGRVHDGDEELARLAARGDEGASYLELIVAGSLGDVVRLGRLGQVILEGPVPAAGVNPAEACAHRALALLQIGRLAEARETLAAGRALDPSSAFGDAVAALAAMAGGDPVEARRLSDGLGIHPRATYLDRFYAAVAAALAGPDPAGALDAAGRLVEETGDELARGILALARSLAEPGDEGLAAEATVRWASLGVDPEGWRRLMSAPTPRAAAQVPGSGT